MQLNITMSVLFSLSLMACHSRSSAQKETALAEKTEEATEAPLTYLANEPQAKIAHPPVVILLHGFGSNEADLFGLKGIFPKDFLVISARAPITVQDGAYQWYRNENINGKPDGNQADLDKARLKIVQLLQYVRQKYHTDASRTFLGGFSQGAIMSYEVALTHPGLLKGILVFSGRILPSLRPIAQWKNQDKLNIFIGHGDADDRIPSAAAVDADQYLKDHKITASFHTYPGMAHSISDAELQDVQDWLLKTH